MNLAPPAFHPHANRVSLRPTVLALHGMTMSGPSMLQAMGTLAPALEGRGYEIVAPSGGYPMTAADLDAFIAWMGPIYSRRGPEVSERLRRSTLAESHESYDWLRADADPFGPDKRYAALEDSLAVLRRALCGRAVEGIVAFSQGAVLGTLLLSLAARGDTRAVFALPRWAILVAGFPPRVSSPLTVEYPIEAPVARLFVIGERDPVFTTGLTHLRNWAACFRGGTDEFFVGPCGHDVPRDEASVATMMDFVARASV